MLISSFILRHFPSLFHMDAPPLRQIVLGNRIYLGNQNRIYKLFLGIKFRKSNLLAVLGIKFRKSNSLAVFRHKIQEIEFISCFYTENLGNRIYQLFEGRKCRKSTLLAVFRQKTQEIKFISCFRQNIQEIEFISCFQAEKFSF